MNLTIASILLSGAIIGGVILFTGGKPAATADNVSVVGGKQVVTIAAKGRYSPRASIAKAGVGTTLNIETNGTFDCTSALTIPSIAYAVNLPSSGVTGIELPPQKAGTTLRGICAMGMQSFSISFE